MAKRKMIQYNLIRNSISAYFAAIEIHNKPNISYRYETVTLLLTNAWELALKAYIRKYIKKHSIYENDGHTISFTKALNYVNEYQNTIQRNSFTSVKENLLRIEDYRNMVTHFYCDDIEPYIFMLVAKSVLNYVDFIKTFFNKDIMADEGLFILPLGFKLPFRPEDFLSDKGVKYVASYETRIFIKNIVNVISDLKDKGIEDSIVLGFDVYLENVKKSTNSDIIAAITSKEKADILISKTKNIRISKDAEHVVRVDDDDYREIYKYNHADLVDWCRKNISEFKQDKKFNLAKKSILDDANCVHERKLDNRNDKSISKRFYSNTALNRIKEYYESN